MPVITPDQVPQEVVPPTIHELSRRVRAVSRASGFSTPESVSETQACLAKLMLVCTEVAEAAEAVRDADLGHLGEELADVVIRVMDLAAGLRIDLEWEVSNKIAANSLRPHMHGRRA